MLTYELVDDYLDRRAPLRPEHLALAQEYEGRGELLLAGALSEPTDRAVLVFAGDDASVAEGFVARDPYVANGLVRSWRVQPWTVVAGVLHDRAT
jgi:uncharacterized protein YciI